VSSETTFAKDISQYRALERLLWQQSERVSARLKAKELSGSTVTLKLKSAEFKIRTRARALETPTQLAARIFDAANDLLRKEADGTRYRLLGVGVSNLSDATAADPDDLVDLRARRTADAEHAMDRLRQKFGDDAVRKGRSLDDE
jgi:DNA polymerase-4